MTIPTQQQGSGGRKTKMNHCFNCGEEIGEATFGWHDPLDHCGKIECAREARYAMQEQREEAHRNLDEQNGW